MPFAAALSQHPLATHAVGEVVGQILETIGPEPDLAVLFVTGGFAGATEDIAGAVRELLRPRSLLGATASSVLAGSIEVEDQAAIALFAASWPGEIEPGAIRTVRLTAASEGDGVRIRGTRDLADDGTTLILLADPFTFPVDHFVTGLAERHPGLTVVGGLASAAVAPGGNRLVADDKVMADGAVGVLLPAGLAVHPVVSQGCRPVGTPLVVTASHDNLIEKIAGRPALERVKELADSLDPDERKRAAQGLQIGVVQDERLEEFGPGDFLVRPVLGADKASGAVAVGLDIEVGTTVQFHVRDADAADQDLRGVLAGEDGAAALVFTCNGRGLRLFGEPHHDARVLHEHVEGGAVAGMFCAGEVGPIGGRPHVHGFSACILLFED